MKFKPIMMLAIVMTLIFTLGQSVYAFKDVKGDPNENKINALKKHGIINGNSKDKYDPQGKLTYAAGISLIVKGLDLNIDNIRFIKEPLATDYFPNLKNNEWYSQAFIIAAVNGLDIPQKVKANDVMTREQFAHHLFMGISAKGNYAFIELYKQFDDEKDVTQGYMNSIQKLLVSEIVQLDKKNKFNPKKNITRSDAAAWLYDAIEFVKNVPPIVDPEPQPDPIYDPKVTVAAVNAEISKVTVTAQVPHPGYGIKIASITFEGQNAFIHLEAVLPDPDKMYPQVIADVEAVTYISSAYKPVLAVEYDKDASVSIIGNN